MKIIHFSKREGIAKLIPDTLDDLWHISKVIEEGDLAGAISSHKVKIGKEDERQRATRRTSFFQITVDKTELDFASETLKLSGTVKKGPTDVPFGSHHTLIIEIGNQLEVIKDKWKQHQISRLNSAKAKVSAKLLACVFDDDFALFASLSDSGIKELGEIELSLARKASMKGSEGEKGYEALFEMLENLSSKASTIVIASPSFWKDDFFKYIKNKDMNLARKVKLESVSSASKSGVQELLNRGVLLDAAKSSRLQEENQLIEELKSRIAKNGAVAYGWSEVKRASTAIEKLAISEKLVDQIRKEGRYSELEELIDLVENSKGMVFIIDSKSDAGRVLDGLGGVAGILRYQL